MQVIFWFGMTLLIIATGTLMVLAKEELIANKRIKVKQETQKGK